MRPSRYHSGPALTSKEQSFRTNLSWRLRRYYNLSVEDYDRMLEEQDNRCAICRCNFKKRCVDHDHKTGLVSGLLCGRCNRGLGGLRDNYQTVAAAAAYLAKHEWGKLLGVEMDGYRRHQT
jgi:hypothetical protein